MDLFKFFKKKSDVGKVLINLIVKLQRQLNVKIKIIQCDGVQEFVSSATKIEQYCIEKGIHIRFFSKDNFAKNGIAEHTNEIQ